MKTAFFFSFVCTVVEKVSRLTPFPSNFASEHEVISVTNLRVILPAGPFQAKEKNFVSCPE